MYNLVNTQGADGAPHAGIAVDDAIFDLEKAMGPVTTMDLVMDWEASHPKLEALGAEAARGALDGARIGAVGDVQLLAPRDPECLLAAVRRECLIASIPHQLDEDLAQRVVVFDDQDSLLVRLSHVNQTSPLG